MKFTEIQIQRLERAGFVNIVVGNAAIRAELANDGYEVSTRQVAKKNPTWSMRGDKVYALLQESAEYLLDRQECLEAEFADGYYANQTAKTAIDAMMELFGNKARADRDANPLGFLSGGTTSHG